MYEFTVFSSASGAEFYWTDLRETSGTVPGTWEWGDGTPLHYPSTDPWSPGEPSSAQSDRAALYNKRLYDLYPTTYRNFICEK